MKKLSFILVICFTLLTSGCFLKEKDLGQMFFPVSLGISYENEKYTIYLQVLNTSTLSIVETETSQSDTTYILIHAEGESISEAFSQLGLKSLTYISAVKLKSIILHTSVLEEGPLSFDELSQYFINSPIFRTRVQVFITDTKIEDFYSVRYMLVGSSVYSHTNEKDPQIIRGYANPTYLIDALKSVKDNNRMYYFPIMDVKEENIKEGGSDGKLKSVKTYFYNGICFSTYTDVRLKCLNKEEAMGIRWYEEIEYINIEVGSNKTPINIIIDKINWKTKIANNGFLINLKIKGQISLNASNLLIEEIKLKLNEEIKKDITNTLKIAYENDIDIYHLNDYSMRTNKNIKYNLENITIDIDTTIENTTYYKY